MDTGALPSPGGRLHKAAPLCPAGAERRRGIFGKIVHMSSPAVSIIVASYNYEQWLPQALQSALDQYVDITARGNIEE